MNHSAAAVVNICTALSLSRLNVKAKVKFLASVMLLAICSTRTQRCSWFVPRKANCGFFIFVEATPVKLVMAADI